MAGLKIVYQAVTRETAEIELVQIMSGLIKRMVVNHH